MNPDHECSRIANLAEALARQCLQVWADSLVTLPAALGLCLLDGTNGPALDWAAWRQLSQDSNLSVRDEAGHSRPIYRWLILHGGLRLMMTWPTPAEPWPSIVLPPEEALSVDLQLWTSLLQIEQAAIQVAPSTVIQTAWARVDQLLVQPGEDGSLHRMNSDESLDAWTWRELVGLHALAHLCVHDPSPLRLKRLREIACYHLENTQPDNITNQPWGLAGFVLGGAATLAEQQLHDVQAHAASLAGRQPPMTTGLLLADTVSLLKRNLASFIE